LKINLNINNEIQDCKISYGNKDVEKDMYNDIHDRIIYNSRKLEELERMNNMEIVK
jgi:hypothetical protein